MRNTRATLSFFWKYTKRYPRDIFLACFVFIQYSMNVILIPLILGLGAAKIGNTQSTSLSFANILWLIAGAGVVAIICNRISNSAVDRLEVAAVKEIHADIAKHIVNESYEFHARSYSGALINQAGRLGSAYVTFIDTMYQSFGRFLMIMFISSAAIAFYDIGLALVMFTIAVLGAGSTIVMVRKRFPLQKISVAKYSEQTAHLADMITNAMTVKMFAAEKEELGSYQKKVVAAGDAVFASWAKQINGNNVIIGMMALLNLSVMAYGIYGVQQGFLAPAVFITAQLYSVRLSGSFWDASSIVRALERVFADAHEMVAIMNTPHTLVDAPDASRLTVSKGALSLNNVTFHYNDTSKEDAVFTNFDLAIQPGEKVGLVGKSGGGKTTVTKLALRFMDIQGGAIEIDGQNIANVTQESLRQAIAYVPQEPLLFHRTIAENIAYGQPEAKKKDVERAAKLAQAHEFITSLPKAYDTEVGERGVKLSGGQKQRVAIARAILKDAPILVLDEATSALDSESEVAIQQALWELMQDRTALVIAHRLSTVQKMDRIIVIDDGKIIEQGTHKQLLAKKGQYAELWDHQSGGFLEA